MFGTKVYSVTGPGASPREGLASSEGIIISDNQDRWGDFWVILWTDGESAGRQEQCFKYSLKPRSEACGIGVYHE